MSFKVIRLLLILALLVALFLSLAVSPLLTPVVFIVGLFLVSVTMTLLPRRFQQPVAGALPTSGLMARRTDALLTALGMMKPRSAESDLAALHSGTTLYTRCVRLDGKLALISLLISAPAGQPVQLSHQRVLAKQLEQFPGPYTLTEPVAMDSTLTARKGKMTEPLEITGSGDHRLLLQLRPMDAQLLRAAMSPQPVAA